MIVGISRPLRNQLTNTMHLNTAGLVMQLNMNFEISPWGEVAQPLGPWWPEEPDWLDSTHAAPKLLQEAGEFHVYCNRTVKVSQCHG